VSDPAIRATLRGTVTVVTVTGEIDYSAADEVERRIVGEDDDGAVVVDLTGVTFIDSTCLRALVSARDSLDGAGRPLTLVPGSTVERLLALTALDGDFTIGASVDDAIAAIG
jgi:anti-sigma B factor antagonist